jgi:hypothetical protein
MNTSVCGRGPIEDVPYVEGSAYNAITSLDKYARMRIPIYFCLRDCFTNVNSSLNAMFTDI